MIDSHTHTRYSKHATGSVDDVVQAALARGVKVLTITDHAPFIVDSTNRLHDSELAPYLEEIASARTRYAGRIKILRGLEVDFMVGAQEHAARLLCGLELDYVIGSIHYLPEEGGRVNVWDLPRLNEHGTLSRFFQSLEESVSCGLFDAIGHPDSLLRAVECPTWRARFLPLVPLFARHGVSYELNASGLRKSSYDPATGLESYGRWSYPCREVVPDLLDHGVTFTVGSDAHAPADVGAGVPDLLRELGSWGLREISYYENRRRIQVAVDDLVIAPNGGHVPASDR